MINKFELNKVEKVERIFLRINGIAIAAIVIKGIYNQENNIDQDYVLYPAILILCTTFCSVYTVNAFISGNLVGNWGNQAIFTSIFNLVKSKSLITDEKATKITIKVSGFFTLSIACFCLVSLIQYWYA